MTDHRSVADINARLAEIDAQLRGAQFAEHGRQREADAFVDSMLNVFAFGGVSQGLTHAQTLHYRRDPIAYAVDVLNIQERTLIWSECGGAYSTHKWDGTFEPLAKICDELAREHDVGAESGTGTGKTFLAAVLSLWFLSCWELSRVVSLAPKADQLRKYMWAEIIKLWPPFKSRFKDAELLSLDLRMQPKEKRDAWSATGWPVGLAADEEVASKAQGAHAEHMLFIFEEGPGIREAVYNAVENTCTSPHNIRLGLGNPNHQLDPLHKYCVSPGVTHVRISAYDHPNIVLADPQIVPGAVSQKSIDRRVEKYGKASRMVQSRVRGIAPAESSDAIIRIRWLEEAARRWEARQGEYGGAPAFGVDVGNSPNGDEAALARGFGAMLKDVTTRPCPNANDLGAYVAIRMDEEAVDEDRVGVDAVGVGAGTVNTLKGVGKLVRALFSQGAAHYHKGEEKFLNLRAQMWWQLRLDLQHDKDLAIPPDDELWADLTTPTYKVENDKIRVESKDKLRGRLGRSPNKGDAVVYWNWVRRSRGGFTGEGGADASF